MRCACIDIGSNTTRLLVADVVGGRSGGMALAPVVERRAFTQLGRACHAGGALPATARKALASVVAAGGKPIDNAPRPGSRGTTVAFVHPKGSFGTLIELVQERDSTQ